MSTHQLLKISSVIITTTSFSRYPNHAAAMAASASHNKIFKNRRNSQIRLEDSTCRLLQRQPSSKYRPDTTHHLSITCDLHKENTLSECFLSAYNLVALTPWPSFVIHDFIVTAFIPEWTPLVCPYTLCSYTILSPLTSVVASLSKVYSISRQLHTNNSLRYCNSTMFLRSITML